MSMTASAKVKITNKLGLHARPAMMFVETASQFESKISARRTDQDETVDGKSIMQLMMLAATKGTELEISAQGPDAQDAVTKLIFLIKSNFSED